jgi:DNA invertase Pin-like site-specific DNA recombinase
LDELNHLNIGLVSFRENIDTSCPLSRAMNVIVSAIAELERSLIVERVRAGMRKAKPEGGRSAEPDWMWIGSKSFKIEARECR